MRSRLTGAEAQSDHRRGPGRHHAGRPGRPGARLGQQRLQQPPLARALPVPSWRAPEPATPARRSRNARPPRSDVRRALCRALTCVARTRRHGARRNSRVLASCGSFGEDRRVLPEVAAGVVLLVGCVACVWAGAVRGSGRLGRLAFAAALACAAIAEFTGTASDWLWVAACALATAGMALLLLDRVAVVSRLSWLDATMGASSSAAVAVSVGADAAAATAVAGAIGSLALSRWRPGWPVVVALVGLVALGAGADLAPLAALASPRRRGRAPSAPSRAPSAAPSCSSRSSRSPPPHSRC